MTELSPWSDRAAPSLAEIETLVDAARRALPEPFRTGARAVAIHVVEFPDDAMLDDLDIDSPFELTGLYQGIPLTERSVMDQPLGPDTVWLFRRPILDEWAERGDVALGALVTHILVHELAHHFGWSDDDIAAIDRWWE